MTSRKFSVVFVATVAWPLRVFMGPHIRKISESCNVTLVADGITELQNCQFHCAVNFIQLAISRSVQLLPDICALFNLWRLLRAGKFDCVHSICPKAGLLSMVAATVAGIPIRFHTFTGQVWVTRKGLFRRLLMFLDWLTASLATSILTDSFSQRDFLIANKIVRPEKISVLAYGSTCGVDLRRFVPNLEVRVKERLLLGIGAEDFVFLFVGRLKRDKGIFDLLHAFSEVSAIHPSTYLLLVGPDEDSIDAYISSLPANLSSSIHRIGFTTCPEKFMVMSDVICLPSYREGFGSVLIEAAACGLPSICSSIYGIIDAVIDQVTGILHEAGNAQQIAVCMGRMIQDSSMRQNMSSAARARVISCFSESILTEAFQDFYRFHGILS